MKFNSAEKEVVFLKAIKRLIGEMVNHEVITLQGNDSQSEIRFNSMTHQKYFNIILVDFLSPSDKNVLGCKQPYLKALHDICQSPNYNYNNSVNGLILPTKDFIEWLEKEVVIEKIWLPSIELETNLSIKRIEFIKICGNISKHNFSRLSGVIRDLRDIFDRNEITLTEEKSLLILDEFYEWFHTNIFNYHSSAIAEFLNNIGWGIYEYLLPEFQQSIVYEENNELPGMYHYTYPKEINNTFAKSCYWDLMNEVRSKPYIEKFQVSKYLKMSY